MWLIPLALLGLAHAADLVDPKSLVSPRETHPPSWVYDPSHALSSQARADIDRAIDELDRATTSQIALVLMPTIGDETPRTFANALLRHWGVGQKGKNNGVVVLNVL